MRWVATVPVLDVGGPAAKDEWNGKSRTKRGKLCDLKSFSLAERPHQRGSVKKKERRAYALSVMSTLAAVWPPSCRVASPCGLRDNPNPRLWPPISQWARSTFSTATILRLRRLSIHGGTRSAQLKHIQICHVASSVSVTRLIQYHEATPKMALILSEYSQRKLHPEMVCLNCNEFCRGVLQLITRKVRNSALKRSKRNYSFNLHYP
jgi:hypothetical protein